MSWSILWLLLIAYGIHVKLSDSVLLAMIYISGTTQTIYIGGQAAVDAVIKKASQLVSRDNSHQ